MSYWLRTSSLLAALLAITSCQALNQHSHNPYTNLKQRQEVTIDDDGDTVYNCLPSCEFSGTSATRRSFSTQFQHANESSVQHLTKRLWRITTNGNLVNAQPQWRIEDVNEYMYNQVELTQGTYDNNFAGYNGGQWNGLFNGRDEGAVSNHEVFGTTNFQIGSRGIHGCQVVTVVSPRGVWMAHFWESYTNGKPNTDDVGMSARRATVSRQAFDERMVYHLTNQPVTDPSPGLYTEAYPERAPTLDHPYIRPDGDPLDKNAAYITTANQGRDITVYIATPVADDQQQGGTLKYRNRVNRVRSAMMTYLGSKINIVEYGYQRLVGDEVASATDPRGLYLFQYDANADGNGNAQWRLFYENAVYP